jgi:hypothetical protein
VRLREVPSHFGRETDARVGEAERTTNRFKHELLIALSGAAGEREAEQAEAEAGIFEPGARRVLRPVARATSPRAAISVNMSAVKTLVSNTVRVSRTTLSTPELP